MCMLGPTMGGRMYHSSVANICKCPVCNRTNWQFNHMLDRLWDCETYITLHKADFGPDKLQKMANMVTRAEMLANVARDSFRDSGSTPDIWLANRDAVYQAITEVLHVAGVTP
jgi:hypothetical protein